MRVAKTLTGDVYISSGPQLPEPTADFWDNEKFDVRFLGLGKILLWLKRYAHLQMLYFLAWQRLLLLQSSADVCVCVCSGWVRVLAFSCRPW